jgi:hypothetical protein
MISRRRFSSFTLISSRTTEASRRIGLSTMLITLSLAMLISFLTPDGVLITEVV